MIINNNLDIELIIKYILLFILIIYNVLLKIKEVLIS